eukprot:gene22471-29590_t
MEIPASGASAGAEQLALENARLRQQLDQLALQHLSASAAAEIEQREMELMLKDLMVKQVEGADIASAILPVLQKFQRSGRYSTPALQFLPLHKRASVETCSLFDDVSTIGSCSAATAAPSDGSEDACMPLIWARLEGRTGPGRLSYKGSPVTAKMDGDTELSETFVGTTGSTFSDLTAPEASAGVVASPKDILEPRTSVKPSKITWAAPPPWEDPSPRPNASSLPSYIVATTAEGTATSSAFSCMVMRDDSQRHGSAVFSIRRSCSSSTFTSQGAAALAARLGPASVTESVEEMDSDLLKDSFIRVVEVPSSEDVKSKVRGAGGGLASALKSPMSIGRKSISDSQLVLPSIDILAPAVMSTAPCEDRGALQGPDKRVPHLAHISLGIRAKGGLFGKKLSTISDSPWNVTHASSTALPEAMESVEVDAQAARESQRQGGASGQAATRGSQPNDGISAMSSLVSSYTSSVGEELFAVSVGTPTTPQRKKEARQRNRRNTNSTGKLITASNLNLLRLDSAQESNTPTRSHCLESETSPATSPQAPQELVPGPLAPTGTHGRGGGAVARKQPSSNAPRVVSRQQQRLFHAARSLVQLNEAASGRESASGGETSDFRPQRTVRRTSMGGHLAEGRLEAAHQLTALDPAASGRVSKSSKGLGGRQNQIAAMQASAALFLRENCRA